MDKETEILSRLAANHLHLAQFEPLKATLLALRVRNPDLALTILQTIVSNAGRFDNVLWSRSCPSPSLLSFLSTIELLRFENPTSPWGFDSETLSLRADFLLMVQVLIDRVTERIKEDEESEDENSGLGNCLRVLQGVLELGVERLKFVVDTSSSEGSNKIEEDAVVSLRSIVLDYSDVFDALCCNIQRQLAGCESYGTCLVEEVQGEEQRKEMNEATCIGSPELDNINVFALIQRNVQLAQLDAMKTKLDEGDERGAADRIRYLHLDYGVEKENYHAVLKALLSRVMEKKDEYGDSWHMVRQNLLFMYKEALSSNCGDLVQMIQGIQDDMLLPHSQLHLSLDNEQIPLPLECFRRYLVDLKTERNIEDKSSPMSRAINSCLRDMYHYARISGSHVLECVMCAALSSVKKEKLQEANDVLTLFPRLRPLVASMGWDLLPGKTATRRKLMRLLWTSDSQALRLEESSLYGNQTDEKSCVEHLCDTLCYQLELASFAACVNSGKSWTPKASFLMHGNVSSAHDDAEVDPFVENLVLERLSAQSPLRVLFDVVPGIKFQDAISLISMQPIASTAEAWKRIEDIELMHMRYALEAIVLALGAMEEAMKDETDASHRVVFYHLKDLTNHLEAIKNVPRKIMMVNIVISLLHIDDIRLSSTQSASSACFSEKSNTPGLDPGDLGTEGEKEIVISFTKQLLDVLRRNLPSHPIEQECQLDGNYSTDGRQALEWRVSMAKRFIEDCEWRLSVMQHLLPLSERQWGLKEVLSILRAAPEKLLNLCMQRAKYDIGEEAVNRFALSAEDKATLELAEWVDNAFKGTLVEDVMSRTAEGAAAVQDLDFHSLGSQLSPLAMILLCIDAAASSAKSPTISKQLLDKSQVMLSEIYPGGAPKVGFTYWDQVHEVAIISVLRRILKRLQEFLEQDDPQILQASFSGDTIISSCTESHRQGQKDRALAMLHQMIEDAHRGKRQFLSGKLHNLARALADEKPEVDVLKGDGSDMAVEKDGVLGLGLKYTKQSPGSANRAVDGNPVSHETEDKGKKSFGPLSNKTSTYLSQFILYTAAIGDIVDGTDTTHDFNFFSLVYEWPKDLLTRLVFDRSSTDAAAKVAEVMSADFVHEVISACVPPVYPPRSGHGWACIPVIPTTPCSHSEGKVLSPSIEAKPNCYVRSSATPGVPLYPLQLDVIRHLVKISPVRAVLACVFGGSILYNGSDSIISSSLNDEFPSSPDADRLFYEFSLDQSERYPTLNRWIQMQTNLHRVSEFVVTPKQKPDDTRIKPDERTGIKRLLEHDSDSESDTEETFSKNNIQPALTDGSARDGGSFENGVCRTDPTVFLSFDWENEVPYEKAVNRLIDVSFPRNLNTSLIVLICHQTKDIISSVTSMAPPVSDDSLQPRDVCVVGVARTPIGDFLGSLSSLTATRLGSIAIQAALKRAHVDPALVEEVFFGNVLTANLGQAPARQAALGAGIPYSVICTTINKVCAAGMKSVMLASQSIQLGLNDIVVAGGMESMSNVPKYLPDARRGSRLGHDTVVDGMMKDGLWDVYNDFGMGVCGEICADQYRITREEQDAYAIQSFERGIAAQNTQLFAWEIVPVEVSTGRGRPSVVIDKDEGLGKFDAAKLKKLRPSFKEDGGSVTAGNASSISDGAAALVLVSGEKALELGLHVIAKIRGYADAAQAPELFTTTPALAIPKAIKRAGLDASQVDYYEINEAFSVVALANQKLLGLDPERLNAHGGAVSLGHPLGCSGARILVTLLGVLRAKKGKYGVASICNGGGGASALVLEFMSEKTIGYSAL